jgi:GDP-D-mannose dehydratase
MYYNHPYAIAKTMGHNMVHFYRYTYGLPFSNGIFFTIESPRKRPEFLLNKVAIHAKMWRTSEKIPLKLGNLDSYRNILHAKDAAKAIRKIMEQPKGDTYVICNKESALISTLVFKMYEMAGVRVVAKPGGIYEIDTNLQVVCIEQTGKGLDIQPIDIRGEPVKLEKLGWNPTFSIDDILNDIIMT